VTSRRSGWWIAALCVIGTCLATAPSTRAAAIGADGRLWTSGEMSHGGPVGLLRIASDGARTSVPIPGLAGGADPRPGFNGLAAAIGWRDDGGRVVVVVNTANGTITTRDVPAWMTGSALNAAVAPDGTVWIAEQWFWCAANTGRIARIAPDGAVERVSPAALSYDGVATEALPSGGVVTDGTGAAWIASSAPLQAPRYTTCNGVTASPMFGPVLQSYTLAGTASPWANSVSAAAFGGGASDGSVWFHGKDRQGDDRPTLVRLMPAAAPKIVALPADLQVEIVGPAPAGGVWLVSRSDRDGIRGLYSASPDGTVRKHDVAAATLAGRGPATPGEEYFGPQVYGGEDGRVWFVGPAPGVPFPDVEVVTPSAGEVVPVSEPAGPAKSPSTAASDASRVTITRVRLASGVVRTSRRGRASVGLRLRASGPVAVRVRVRRAREGRQVGGKCVRDRSIHRRRRGCTRWVYVREVRFSVRAGDSRRMIDIPRATPGRYRIDVQARRSATAWGEVVRRTFRIRAR
jgi:hypothetical protein